MFSEILLDDAKNFNTKINWALNLQIKRYDQNSYWG